MSWLTLYNPPHFDMVFIGYFSLVATVGRMVFRRNPRQQAWIISAFATTMISVLGSAELIAWIMTPPTIFGNTAMSHMLLEFLKAYLLVDLLYSALCHPAELALAEGWIHHLVYIFMAEKLQQTHQINIARPFWVAEIPTAIRAWQAMGAISAQVADNWFGATFVAFRIIWPIYAITQLATQDWVFAFIGLAIVAHIAWMFSWIKAQRQQYMR